MAKYKREEFKEHTHRFIVSFNDESSNMTFYSNSGDHKQLEAFIDKKKSNKVKNFKIIHCSTKEQDEATSKFIDELLKDL